MNASLGRVLVVDDDASILRACARVLAGEGWTVTQAGDVRTAMLAIAMLVPDQVSAESSAAASPIRGMLREGRVRGWSGYGAAC